MKTSETDHGAEPFTEPLSPLPATQENPEEGGGEARGGEKAKPAVLRTELIREGGVPATRKEGRRPLWMFWKKRRPQPDPRSEQLETLRHGTAEMVRLMRSIRDHLAGERAERRGLSESLSPLPVAGESLRSMSESHAVTGRMLGELKTSMERSAEKDGFLLKSLNRIGETMNKVDETFGGMDRTLGEFGKSNQRTVQAMEELGRRVEDSDRFMNETFARLREAEREFTDYVSRASRRGTFAMVSVCSMLLLSIVAVGFMFKENRELLTAARANGPLIVQVPAAEGPPERVAILDELERRDDGTEEPDREVAEAGSAREEAGEGGEGFRMETTPEQLLSVSELPRR